MNDSTQHYSPRAALAAVGVKMQQLHLFEPIAQQVSIRQKTVKHTPAQKLYDAFISLLAGAGGLVEINKRVRSDPALHAPSVGTPAPNSRWCNKRWTPAPKTMSSRCRQPSARFTVGAARASGITTSSICNSLMPT